MSKSAIKAAPPDQSQREKALCVDRSILVQAPAGSGKTDLLTRRFLRLLGEVDDPGQIVAITFTKAAAAEMRIRILAELEKASAAGAPADSADDFSMEVLAHRALLRSQALGWQLQDLPANLRISTIDSFCRELAIQQPLLSHFGADLRIDERPSELYRRAARNTLKKIAGDNPESIAAVEVLLLWRDNNWSELEKQLIQMLGERDRWMHDFVLQSEPDWNALRERLERPFTSAVSQAIGEINRLLDQVPGARNEAMELARFACEQSDGALHRDLAKLPEFPTGPWESKEALDDGRCALLGLAELVLTQEGSFRIQINKTHGFPSDRQFEKARLTRLIADLKNVDGLEAALCDFCTLPPPRYSEEDWHIVRTCFTLLRQAAAELQIVFAEAGSVDFIEVAQIAQRVLAGEDGLPNDAAIAVADGIRHLLVDEFQDTSRRQHRLLADLAAAWPDLAGRTFFVVGDPIQSIYFFRDADAELFPRVRQFGLEIPGSDPLLFDFVSLTANFRTRPALVNGLNEAFDRIFAKDDGSGIEFSPAEPAHDPSTDASPRFTMHFEFMPQSSRDSAGPGATRQKEEIEAQRNEARENQTAEIVALIGSHLDRVEQARSAGTKYRVAVLARARSSLEPIAIALRKAAIPFRAVDLERLNERPEVLDALALGRAFLNPFDRVAWLGVLRAPWCGLALEELYTLTGGDQPELLERPVPRLIEERIHFLSDDRGRAVERVQRAIQLAPTLASTLSTTSLGTWLEQIWLSLGGASCVDSTAQANLKLLWRCLDNLPNGAQDFLGPALDSALDALTAMPDPAASIECGVQLMTIHKSKGLEFEVVIVPELQARGRNTGGKLLSWLERGLAEPDSSGEITEFLVAPIQTRGGERSSSKQWVDRMYRERESQEMRRILYVAATRAREELHFFARPEYKDAAGMPTLIEPSNCLLATAWPAFEEQLRACFNEWQSARTESRANEELLVETIAASANLEAMPSPAKPTLLRRLPAGFASHDSPALSSMPREQNPVQIGDPARYMRHEGGIASRALGTAVHTLLEECARLRMNLDWTGTRVALLQMQARIKAQIRATGLTQAEANSIAFRALNIAQQATTNPLGQWILSPHAEAASEASWSGIVADGLRSIRVDRVFRAGLEPQSEGQDAWWIIDYKTAHAINLDPSVALLAFRNLFAPQLEAYAVILRGLHGEDTPIRAGLYYPRMSMFDWWAVES